MWNAAFEPRLPDGDGAAAARLNSSRAADGRRGSDGFQNPIGKLRAALRSATQDLAGKRQSSTSTGRKNSDDGCEIEDIQHERHAGTPRPVAAMHLRFQPAHRQFTRAVAVGNGRSAVLYRRPGLPLGPDQLHPPHLQSSAHDHLERSPHIAPFNLLQAVEPGRRCHRGVFRPFWL